jgi:hypothetical protein
MYLYAYIMEIENLAVTVNIPGIGDVTAMNAAQDSTLTAILSQLQAGMGKTVSTAGLKAANSAASSAAKSVGTLGSTSRQTGSSFEQAGFQAKKAGNSFANASMRVFSSFGQLATQSTSASGLLSGFGNAAAGMLKSIPVFGAAVGGAAGLLTGILTKNIESYEKIVTAGGGFGYSLTQMQDISHSAGLTLGQMAGIVQKASGSLSMFGGTTLDGARKFAAANAQIRKEAGGQLLRMGINFQDQGQYLAEFMGDLARGGADISRLDTKELQDSFMKLTSQQKTLANYNGITLEQQRQLAKAHKEDAQLQGSMLGLPAEARNAASEFAGNIGQAIPGMEKVFKEMILTGGAPFSAEAVALADAFPSISAGLFKAAREFEGGRTDVSKGFEEMMSGITQGQLDSAGRMGVAQAFGSGGPVVNAIVGALLGAESQFRKARGETFKKAESEMADVENNRGKSELDKNVFALSEAANRIAIDMETISSNILNSEVVNTVLGQLANFGDGVANASAEIIEKINEAAGKSGSGSGSSESLTAAIAKIGVTLTAAVTKSVVFGMEAGFKSLLPNFLGGSPSLSSSSGTPATPAANPSSGVSRAALQEMMITGGNSFSAEAAMGANVPNESLQLASGEGVIPDDVADAMRSTPMLIQELTAQVRRSSEDNARIVQQAIMHA